MRSREKPPQTEDACSYISPETADNLVYITNDSRMALARDVYGGSPGNTPSPDAFELVLRQLDFTLALPCDVELQLLVGRRPVSFRKRPCYSGILTSRSFISEALMVPPGAPRILFSLTGRAESLRRTLFEFQLARYNRVDNGVLERFVLGRRVLVRRVKLVPEIFGVCRFYGSQLALNGACRAEILSGRLDKIIGQAVFNARRITVDASLDACQQFPVTPWSPDPRVKLVSARMREALTQTHELLDADGYIVEM